MASALANFLAAPLAGLATLSDMAGLASPPAVRKLYTFPTGSVFLENIVSTRQGKLLMTTFSHPSVYSYDPADPSTPPRVFATIESESPPINGVSGIAPIGPSDSHDGSEMFAVIGAVWQMQKMTSTDTEIWTFNVSSGAAAEVGEASTADGAEPSEPIKMTKAASLPADAFGNGMIRSPIDPYSVLVADSYAGNVRSVSLKTGETRTFTSDEDMEPATDGSGHVPLGINGVRYHGGFLYWTNSNKGLFARKRVMPVHDVTSPDTPSPVDSVLTRVIARADENQTGFDDFALGEHGLDRGTSGKKSQVAWIASHPNSLIRVSSSGHQTIVVGGGNSTILGPRLGPTSVHWGQGSPKEERTLYVVTGDGSITAVDTKILECEMNGGKMYFGILCLGAREHTEL